MTRAWILILMMTSLATSAAPIKARKSTPAEKAEKKAITQEEAEEVGLAAVYSKRLRREEFRSYNLPDDCDKPFQDEDGHSKFFESAISAMAINRTHLGQGVIPLFAVAELKYRFQSMFPNLSEESPIDRLLVAQMCKFREFRTQQLKPGATKSGIINSFDTELHDHLAKVAEHLYKDSRALMAQARSMRSNLTDEELRYRERWIEVIKARRKGREEVHDLLDLSPSP